LIAGGLLAAALIAMRLTMGGGDMRTLLAGGLVSVLALSLAAFVPDRTFVFEPALGRMTWARKRLIGSRRGTTPLTDIRDVTLQVDQDNDPRRRLLSYRVVLVTREGSMPLSSGREFDREVCERLVARIRELSRDPRSSPASTIASLAAAGQIIDAVILARRDRGMGLAEARDYVESLRKP
jgi:hypothetical protein